MADLERESRAMDEYTSRLTAVEERSKMDAKRIDEISKRQDDFNTIINKVAVMANEQAHLVTDVAAIRTDVKKLTDRDGKRWEAVVEKIIGAIITAAIGYIMYKIGLAR